MVHRDSSRFIAVHRWGNASDLFSNTVVRKLRRTAAHVSSLDILEATVGPT